MYAYIRGEVADIGIDRVVVEANGVGYELNCSLKTLAHVKKGALVKLLTHLHLAEDIMALYGFHDEAERVMFRRLLSVTRVGPKLALAVLSHLTPADIAAAIVTDNADALARAPGMGKKTAQRVLLELKGAVGTQEMISAGLPASATEPSDIRTEAVAALVSLGYDGVTASRAVTKIDQAASVEECITLALRALAKG